MDTEVFQAPRVLALGDAAWTVEFGREIDATVNARVMDLADRVALLRQDDPVFAAVCDVVPTFRSLTVHFDPMATDADALASRLLALGQPHGLREQAGRHWRLPVCFDSEFAPDLPRLAEARGLTQAQVIARLLDTEFRVYMIGFLPGFPYMGGLPPELAMPRLASPRPRVPKNSLAVAGEMCSVYPWESPGGWNLLGRTPLPLFDLGHAQQPAMLAAGDRVRWRSVPREEYERLSELGHRGAWSRDDFLDTEASACPA